MRHPAPPFAPASVEVTMSSTYVANPPTAPSAMPPQVGDRIGVDGVFVEVYARAKLPTRHGDFDILVFRDSLDDKEHVALVKGELGRYATAAHQAPVVVRLHSECLTGDVLTSLRCDCRDQLEMALALLAQAEAGVLLYMRQEGRGIGLGNKVRAYALQEQGLDTIDANRHLGFDDDMRDYRVAALMLKMLQVRAIELCTNNPRKLFALRALGIEVARRVPLVAPKNDHNAAYLAAKQAKAGHMLPPAT